MYLKCNMFFCYFIYYNILYFFYLVLDFFVLSTVILLGWLNVVRC